jgi:hypothetical protein
MKEAPGSSETSDLTRATRRNNQEDTILHSYRRENLKSYDQLRFHCIENMLIVAMLQAKRSRVRDSMMSLKSFTLLDPFSLTTAPEFTEPVTEKVIKIFCWAQSAARA